MEQHDIMQQYYEDRRRQIFLLKLRRRRIRDAGNPYDVTVETFTGSYRLTQDLVRSLLDLIRPHIHVRTSPLAVPLEIKVRFLIWI